MGAQKKILSLIKEIDKHNIFLQKVIRSIDSRATVTIVGSYLRNHPDSGDIDILITHLDNDINIYKRFISRLGDVGYISELLAYGNKKFMGLAKLSGHKYHRRIDVLYTPIEEYPFALLYFTGSGRFNTAVRLISKPSLLESDSLGKRIGHIMMLKEEGIRITDEYNTLVIYFYSITTIYVISICFCSTRHTS